MAEEAGPAIKPGEQTTEYAVQQTSALWSKILMISGLVLSIVPQIIDALKSVPGVETNHTLAITLTILGILVTLAGAVKNALTSGAYIQGRSLVKAAAARDLPPPPTVAILFAASSFTAMAALRCMVLAA